MATLLRPLPSKPGTTNMIRPGAKTFSIATWDGSTSGEKIILYGETGMGKTTLASLSPNPVFIGLDDGGRKIKNPKTGEPLRHIPNVYDFNDVRGALQACLNLDCDTVVLDTVTLLESLAEAHMLATVPGPNGSKAVNIESYGYGKGYKHLYDTMSLPLLDCDKLVAAGKHVIIIAQSTTNRIANPGGDDFLCDCPRLYNGKPSVLGKWCEWSDHVFRIGYHHVVVEKKNKIATSGKASGSTTRVIFTKPEVYFMAKSRTLDDPIISFADKTDDSLWQLLFD